MKSIKVLLLWKHLTTEQTSSIQGHDDINKKEQPDQQVGWNQMWIPCTLEACVGVE